MSAKGQNETDLAADELAAEGHPDDEDIAPSPEEDLGGHRRWQPDHQLIPAILADPRGRSIKTLTGSDRCWVVAGLSQAGYSAKEIALRLRCSLRTIRAVKALDMTQMCFLMHTESEAFEASSRMAEAEMRGLRSALRETEGQLERTRRQRDNMIDATILGVKLCGKCGTPMTGYNVYEYRGKRDCRVCIKRRKDESRLREKARRLGVDVEVLRQRQNVDSENVTPATVTALTDAPSLRAVPDPGSPCTPTPSPQPEPSSPSLASF